MTEATTSEGYRADFLTAACKWQTILQTKVVGVPKDMVHTEINMVRRHQYSPIQGHLAQNKLFLQHFCCIWVAFLTITTFYSTWGPSPEINMIFTSLRKWENFLHELCFSVPVLYPDIIQEVTCWRGWISHPPNTQWGVAHIEREKSNYIKT